MTATTVVVVMDDEDFDMLPETSMAWAGIDWEEKHPGRFIPARSAETEIRWNLTRAYWLGDPYASVLLARAFLQAREEEFQVLVDDSQGQFVIVTNYEARAARKV